jgi:hypothetical protein
MQRGFTHGGDNLELLALAVLGLGNGLLETGDGLGIELLGRLKRVSKHVYIFPGGLKCLFRVSRRRDEPGRR